MRGKGKRVHVVSAQFQKSRVLESLAERCEKRRITAKRPTDDLTVINVFDAGSGVEENIS